VLPVENPPAGRTFVVSLWRELAVTAGGDDGAFGARGVAAEVVGQVVPPGDSIRANRPPKQSLRLMLQPTVNIHLLPVAVRYNPVAGLGMRACPERAIDRP
jgi:hypothetical protein